MLTTFVWFQEWGLDSFKTGCKWFHYVSLPIIALSIILPLEWTSMDVWNSWLGKMVRDSKAPTQNLGQASIVVEHWTGDGCTWWHTKNPSHVAAWDQDGFVYIFGGWNGDSQFNDLLLGICTGTKRERATALGHRTKQHLSDLRSQSTWTAVYGCT